MQNKRLIIFWISIILFILCISFIITWFVLQKRNSDVYKKMQEINKELVESIPTESVNESISVSENKVEIPINFAEIQTQNPDIYAWIRIPGTVVDYPILQSATDDSYYLNHSADGKEGLPGSIYTESVNVKDFSDRNTVIYGHDMKNGSMFGGLSAYLDKTYLENNPNIIIYTPEHIYTYRIFGVVTYDNRHIMNSFDFTTDVGYKEYLDSIYSVRNMSTYFDETIEVDVNDRIITLSTCNGNKSQRFLIEAVLIDEQ